MMRLESQPYHWRIGPALCGGLSLIHYKSFQAAASLNAVKEKYETEMSEYLDWGIHVMVSQMGGMNWRLEIPMSMAYRMIRLIKHSSIK